MVICPICKFTNPPRITTCHQCGVPVTQHKFRGTTTIPQPKHVPLLRFILTILPTSIHFDAHDTQLSLTPGTEIYLGREFADDFSQPYLDLQPFDASAYGVSRLHARLQQDYLGRYHILDMRSTNGTFLNGERLTSFRQYLLRQKSLLSLGNFPILVQFTDA